MTRSDFDLVLSEAARFFSRKRYRVGHKHIKMEEDEILSEAWLILQDHPEYVAKAHKRRYIYDFVRTRVIEWKFLRKERQQYRKELLVYSDITNRTC